MKRGALLRVSRVALAGAALALVLAACGGGEYVPAGIVREPLPDVSEVALPDATTGTDLAMQADADGVLLVFFGYTNFVVSPFLILYASGFLFVGIVSIAHFRRPELVDLKLDGLRARPVA